MERTYRLGVIGFAHMHVNGLLDAWSRVPGVEWVACADTNPDVPPLSEAPHTRRANLARAREVTGIPRVYGDYREMLTAETFDVVIFCPENARHAEVAEAIAGHGAHMLTEKPMAANLVDARRMARAAREADVALMINWPITWSPAIRTAKRLLDEGVIGEVWEIKWRNGASMGPLTHADPQPSDEEKGAEWWHRAGTGGGALLDYCCYGACLSCWYLGEQALAAWGIMANLRSPYAEVEDNAVIGVRFPRALAILEGTWTTWHTGVHSGVIVYGSEGTLVAPWNDDVALFTARAGEPGVPDQVVESDPLPAGRATPAEAFVHHLETGASLHRTLTVEHNLEAMAILDAGRRAAESGRLEAVEGEVQI